MIRDTLGTGLRLFVYLCVFLAIALVIVLLTTGCGSSHKPYPTEVTHNFLVTCEGGGDVPASYCNCLISYFEDHVSLEDFNKVDAELTSNGGDIKSMPDWVYKAAANCNQ
jgi:hypothetical protein